MTEAFLAFLESNASAVFGLAGALGGALLTSVAGLLARNRDFKLRAWEKVLERRIAAHENVLSIAAEMRVMYPLGGVDSNDEVRRAPMMVRTREDLERSLTRFGQASFMATTWLNIRAKRELSLVQDYFVTLHVYLEGVASESYPAIGEIIRQDFIDLSASLEKASHEYFTRDIGRRQLPSLRQHHKYQIAETGRRLEATALVRNSQRIRVNHAG